MIEGLSPAASTGPTLDEVQQQGKILAGEVNRLRRMMHDISVNMVERPELLAVLAQSLDRVRHPCAVHALTDYVIAGESTGKHFCIHCGIMSHDIPKG